MIWHKAESGSRPKELDTTSSNTTNYIRRNIVEAERIDEISGESHSVYEYEEAFVSKAEWDEVMYVAIKSITPYTATQTVYYGESEKVFYDVPQGNITVFFDNDYSVSRLDGTVTIRFEAVTENTDITIMIQ